MYQAIQFLLAAYVSEISDSAFDVVNGHVFHEPADGFKGKSGKTNPSKFMLQRKKPAGQWWRIR